VNPLSAVFGAGVAFRNSLYARGVLKTHRLARPVVSVGNISVGGSGKTPFVIALGELLKERGIAFDVLSRGYGRASKDIAVVNPQGTAEEFGDEPLLIARKLEVPVIVGADRHRAGLLAEEKFPSRLHLLDDGFQHRRLHRDFDIVMLRAEDMKDTLLPVGRLREPLSALRRAQAIVLEPGIPAPPEAVKVWRVRRELVIESAAQRVVAFCGIAHPEQFFSSLKAANVELAETMAFRDHQRYGQDDIDQLLETRKRTRADRFVTTEKDMVKLEGFVEVLRPIETPELRLQFEPNLQVVDEILRFIRED